MTWRDFRLEVPDPALPVSFSNFLSTSVSSCTQLIEKPVRITKPWGGGPLSWIRSSPNWHLVFLTLHYNCEWECMHAQRWWWWWCRVEIVLHFSLHGYLWGWEGVSGCLWNLIVCECQRDRKQREEDRRTKRGDRGNDKRRDEGRHQKIRVHAMI